MASAWRQQVSKILTLALSRGADTNQRWRLSFATLEPLNRAVLYHFSKTSSILEAKSSERFTPAAATLFSTYSSLEAPMMALLTLLCRSTQAALSSRERLRISALIARVPLNMIQ